MLNACEAIVSNPQLYGAINAQVRRFYGKHRDLMEDSSFDVEDLTQELMLELCEEKQRSSDELYTLLCHNRLQNIADKLRRRLTDDDGDRVEFADCGLEDDASEEVAS